MEITKEDLEKFQKLAFYIENSADWKLNTVALFDVTNSISWFNQLGQKMKADLDAMEAEKEKGGTTEQTTDTLKAVKK